MFSGFLQTPLLAIGTLTSALLAWRLLSFVHLYFVRRSTLPRYLHPSTRSHGATETWALVTGASDGIGFATARALRRRGFSVVLHGRNAAKLERCARRLLVDEGGAAAGKSVLWVAASAAEGGDAAEAVRGFVEERVQAKGGRLTVLVNNVGGAAIPNMSPYTSLPDLSAAQAADLIAVNAVFPAQLTRALLPTLLANQPSLVLNVGSYAGEQAPPWLTMYAGSKAFNHAFSRALSREMRAEGHDVEVLGVLVAQVSSATNPDKAAFLVLSSEEMAEAMLERVGCGLEIVVGSWRHCVAGESMKFMLSERLQRWVLSRVIAQRRREEGLLGKEQ